MLPIKRSKELTTNIMSNKDLASVIWRNLVIPITIGLVFSALLRLAFMAIPENIITTDFLAGWISCIVFIMAKEHYAI